MSSPLQGVTTSAAPKTIDTGKPDSKKPKPAKAQVQDLPVPRTSGRLAYYKMWHFLNWRWLPKPSLSKKDIENRRHERELQMADDREAYIIDKLQHIFNSANATVGGEELQWKAFRGVVAILNQKGGSAKSSLSVAIANIIATVTKKAVIIVPATRNPGSTTLKAGASAKDTLNLLELEKLLLELTNNKQNIANTNDVTERLRHNGYGVYVVAQTQLPDDFNGLRLRWIIEQLRGAFPFVVLDTGNDVARQNGVEFEASRQADALVFTCATNMPDSPNLMGKTMDSYSILSNIEKLSRSLVVVNGTGPDEDVEYWAKVAEHKLDEQGRVIGVRDFKYCVLPRGEGKSRTGKMIFIPWDESIVNHPVPQLNLLRQETYRAYLEVVFEIIMSIGKERKLDFETLDVILEADAALNNFDYRRLSDELRTPAEVLLAEQLATDSVAPTQGEHS
jgi:MinD-like ATPase involved in chromosome partitioning or flagellar assembly